MLPDPSPEEMEISDQNAEVSAGSRQETRRSVVDVNVALRRAYDTAVKEDIPDSLLSLLEKLSWSTLIAV